MPDHATPPERPTPAPARRSVWIDLLNASDGERREIQRRTGLRVPTLAALSEIERSSRLSVQGEALYMSLPVVAAVQGGQPLVTPLGFVLTPTRLLTVRFTELEGFAAAAERCRSAEASGTSSAELFAVLLEGLVDRVADALERITTELDEVSHRIFYAGTEAKGAASLLLRGSMRTIGRLGELVSKLREMLLGIARIVPFVMANAATWLPNEVRTRFKTLRADVASLSDFDGHLSQQVQFLQESTLGLINIEQSNIIKVMTVVSVIAMPPTLIASIYGMNFKVMPELEWSWGYPFALVLIVVSALIPLAWFRLRRWL